MNALVLLEVGDTTVAVPIGALLLMFFLLLLLKVL